MTPTQAVFGLESGLPHGRLLAGRSFICSCLRMYVCRGARGFCLCCPCALVYTLVRVSCCTTVCQGMYLCVCGSLCCMAAPAPVVCGGRACVLLCTSAGVMCVGGCLVVLCQRLFDAPTKPCAPSSVAFCWLCLLREPTACLQEGGDGIILNQLRPRLV